MEDIGMSSKQFIQAWEKCGENCNFEKVFLFPFILHPLLALCSFTPPQSFCPSLLDLTFLFNSATPQGITQQIVAADDFLCFKVMMVQRNIDLEKKAWELVKQQRKSTNFQEPPPSYGAIVYGDDENALQQALEMSKREYELRRQTEEEELRNLIAMAEAQWATERQCVKLPATVPTAPMLATVPTAPMLATVPTAPIPATVPTAPMLATVPTTPIPAIVPTTPIPATVPTAPVPATVSSTWASTIAPVEGSCMSTMPDIDQHLPSEETWTEGHTPQLHLPSEETWTEGHTPQPHLPSEETWTEGHTPQPLAETTESPVGGVSHTPQPQAETVGCEVSHTSQGPDHYKPDSLGSPPGHCDLSGAEAAALWILSAREELSSSPPKVMCMLLRDGLSPHFPHTRSHLNPKRAT